MTDTRQYSHSKKISKPLDQGLKYKALFSGNAATHEEAQAPLVALDRPVEQAKEPVLVERCRRNAGRIEGCRPFERLSDYPDERCRMRVQGFLGVGLKQFARLEEIQSRRGPASHSEKPKAIQQRLQMRKVLSWCFFEPIGIKNCKCCRHLVLFRKRGTAGS